LRKRTLTDLTLKFSKIITLGNSFDLFFNFAIDPCFETTHVYHSTTSLAMARRNQGITLSLLITKTNFTTSFSFLFCFLMFFHMFLNLENSVCLLEMVGWSKSRSLDIIFWLDDHVLNSSKLNYISGFYMRTKIRRG
jgi:hypothetical protein